MKTHTVREEITEIVNKLFVYTDYQKWQELQNEVFSGVVDFDMSSLGGEVKKLKSAEICQMWKDGFAGLDAVNHLAGNYIIEVRESVHSYLPILPRHITRLLQPKGKRGNLWVLMRSNLPMKPPVGESMDSSTT